MKLLILVALVLAPVAVCSEELTGPAHVIDGDSIRIADVEIRMYRIDAPEAKQFCIAEGEDWARGFTT